MKIVKIVSVVQEHCDKNDYKTEVLLIRDDDGIFKILKEKISYPQFSGYIDEDIVMSLLSNLNFVPKLYGISKFKEKIYLRRSFVYGQPLSDYCFGNKLLSTKDVFFIISDIARKLKILEEHNILFFDLKPDNIILSNEVNFFDLGLCRYRNNDDPFVAIMSHPRFSAPEMLTRINSKSIIFQLGLITHELLYGYHPADKTADVRNIDWEYCKVKYLNPISKKIPLITKISFLDRMLSYNDKERPLLDNCAEFFSTDVTTVHVNRKFKPNSSTVLFPARMGIPHYGHIEYMSRLIDLGYKLIISIQRSYTLTDTDPIPKWIVAKMVAQSLFKLGYSSDCFDIYLTPFYENDSLTKMHFCTFPQKFNEIASSNISIETLFPSYKVIQQKDVLCHEEDDYEIRSWGEIIRGAVKSNNYSLFKRYAASGVESILNFEEIKNIYPKEDILFVYTNGSVEVQLLNDNEILLSRNVYRYSNPEACLYRDIKNKYSKYPIINYRGIDTEIEYIESQYKDKKLIIKYQIRSTNIQKECTV